MATATPEQLRLRVNGIEIEKAKARPKMVGGIPTSEYELVIEDPKLGLFAIDDTFIIETARGRSKKWEITSVQNFLAMLGSI